MHQMRKPHVSETGS